MYVFDKIDGAGGSERLGTMDADTVPCIHGAMLAMAQANPRLAAPCDIGALAAALDEAFHMTDRLAGERVEAEVTYGRSRVVCIRTLH